VNARERRRKPARPGRRRAYLIEAGTTVVRSHFWSQIQGRKRGKQRVDKDKANRDERTREPLVTESEGVSRSRATGARKWRGGAAKGESSDLTRGALPHLGQVGPGSEGDGAGS
jgi:hypothetical protein